MIERTPERTAHIDTFARDHLPPATDRPVLDFSGIPKLRYRARLNCAVELLDRMVSSGFGNAPAYYFEGKTITYRQLLAEANRIARVLVEDLRMVPGNRVLIRGYNNPTLVATWLAVLKAGGIAVMTMPLLRSRELSYILNKAQINIVFCDARLAEDMQAAEERSREQEGYEPAHIAYFNPETPGWFEAILASKSDSFDNVDTAADDIALIAFTSGTTGQAKGTMHTHRDVIAITECYARYVLKPSPDDVFCGSPPLAFAYGLGGLIVFPMRIGASTVLLERVTPESLLEAIQRYKATICFTAPTMYRAMSESASRYDLQSLKKCVSAGEHLPTSTYERWLSATGTKIMDGIGTTEMLHIFISAGEDFVRPGSTGLVVPGYQARVIDESGRPVPPGTIGRLAVRGPTGCRYLDDPERQRAYVQNGWNITGDSYLVDQDGYFWYQARTDDLIVSAGYNISGPEVENVLLEHPKVLECAVVGAPDAERGSIVKAFVVLRDPRDKTLATVGELQEFVKAEIAPFKYPRAIVFVESLPRTETGKVQRYRLREAEAQRARQA